jgi:hypothetical protein
MTFDPDINYGADPLGDFVEKLRVERDRVGAFLAATEGLDSETLARVGWPAYVELLFELSGEDTETAAPE